MAQRPDDGLVIGGDLGGTSTRIAVTDLDGRPIGRGTASGGNPTAHPTTAADALASALAAALTGVEPDRVRAAVIGIAGGSALLREDVGNAFERVWAEAGLTCEPRFAPDLEVAFAAGTGEPDGTVLVAGTGAGAGAVRSRRLVQTADAHGWLLGDDGSGFWLGREAARATLRTLDAGESPGPLVRSVLAHLGIEPRAAATGRDGARTGIIATLNNRPPVRLAELAPLVTGAYDDGDPMAQAIVDQAATLLGQTLGMVRGAGEQTPIVLAGSLLAESVPVGVRLRERVAATFGGQICTAVDATYGAAWLALASLAEEQPSDDVRVRLGLA